MKFSTTFVTCLALASGVKAAPVATQRNGSHGARVSALAMSELGDAVNDRPSWGSSNWSGGVLQGSDFRTVTGTFTIPNITMLYPGEPTNGTHSVAVWVGIDGIHDCDALLQTGVDLTMEKGIPKFKAWFEWIPGPSTDFDHELEFSVGDSVTMTVTATSKTGGIAMVENNSKGTSVNHTFANETAELCLANADWIVERWTLTSTHQDDSGRSYRHSTQVSPVDFDTLTFTNASATTANGSSLDACNARTESVDLYEDVVKDNRSSSRLQMVTTFDNSSITVSYVRGDHVK
ncbi:concanavalin A-like lectin/glucanase [Aureobasidium pullulans EXF-150]|uniref:Concanavalin A-like lectin/glucanase n=1 Tax=Aureobasidium pullulans EXF-150 TaxID=1043002 RepID=A0A074XSC3_AURPU|nr:concanavalin A-like lectin/glucanase [Aureobasidium pullulans EXF-150]KEQ88503.1 concanavalin A-like lectin/glucanase [Aureobasidium pullulans EXF-150]